MVSPHYDDETLGCGGTIAKKKKLDAQVKLLFMTDGRESHKDFIDPQQLKKIRRQEGLAAAVTLGLRPEDIEFFDFIETRLMGYYAKAVERVSELLSSYQPEQIYIPYRHDPPLDHVATNQIVRSALERCGITCTLYEYPIWFWQHWPWTNDEEWGRDKFRRIVKRTLLSEFRLIADCKHRVFIGDVLDIKKAALAEHRSQMKRMNNNPHWPILDDVSEGEFLACFLQQHEFFYRYSC